MAAQANWRRGLLSDPLLIPYQHDPRFAALAHKVGLPMPGERSSDAKAETITKGAPRAT